MKLRCITILEENHIPILDEITINNNYLYLDSNKYSTLNGIEISMNNINLTFTDLEDNIFAISLNEKNLVDFDKQTKWFKVSPVYKNIMELWGDVVIIKVINNNIYELSISEVDKYIELLKNMC